MNVTGTQLHHAVYGSAVWACEHVYGILHGAVSVLQTLGMIQQDDSYSY